MNLKFINFSQPHLVLFLNISCFFILLIICTNREIVPSWDSFPDNYDYLEQSKNDYTSLDLYSPKRGDRMARAFTVPLLYKITGSDFYNFIIFQTVFYCFCVFIFIGVILRFLKRDLLKLCFIFFSYFFFTWWNIVGWSVQGVSEFISFCFLLLWFSTLLLFLSKKTIPYLIIHCIITLLFSFTRDTWSYIILVTPLILVFFYRSEKRFVISFLMSYFLFSMTVFFVQQKTIDRGERYRQSLINNIFVRVARNSEYMDWFKKEGMPMSDIIHSNFKNLDHENIDDIKRLYRAYDDSIYKPFYEWVVKNGKKTYTYFLLSHPDYILLKDQTEAEIARIFCYNVKVYTGKALGFYANAGNVFPLFNKWLVLLMVFVLMIIGWRSPFDFKYIFPPFVLIITFVNVILSYNAEAMEVERHMYYTTILIEMSGMITVFLLLDEGIDKLLLRMASE